MFDPAPHAMSRASPPWSGRLARKRPRWTVLRYGRSNWSTWYRSWLSSSHNRRWSASCCFAVFTLAHLLASGDDRVDDARLLLRLKSDRAREAQRLSMQTLAHGACERRRRASVRLRLVDGLPQRTRLDLSGAEVTHERAGIHPEFHGIDEHRVQPPRALRPGRLAHQR